MYFLDSVYILFIQIKKVISSYQASHNPAFHLANSAFFAALHTPKLSKADPHFFTTQRPLYGQSCHPN
jgi:hypothetical protein